LERGGVPGQRIRGIAQITSDEDVAFIRATLWRLFARQAGRTEGMLFDFAGTDEEGSPPKLPQLLDPRTFAPELVKTEFLDVQAIKKMASAAAGHSPDLGIILAPMSKAARQFYKFSETSGVVVAAVDPASEAFTDDIRAGDVLLAVGDQAVTTPEQGMQTLAQAEASQQFVALLVSGKDGAPRWVTLYSGYSPPIMRRGPALIPINKKPPEGDQ
jgi:PDZ domain